MRTIPELNEGRLYDLLETAGEQARSSAHLLAQGAEEGVLDSTVFAALMHDCAVVGDEIRAHLLRAHMVSLSKADLEALTTALAAIPTAAAKFVERLALAGKDVPASAFRAPLVWVEELGEIVLDMVRQLRGFESLDHLKALNVRLLRVADEAEALTDGIVTRDYQAPASALHAMMMKELCDQLDVTIDRCREAGAIMTRISLDLF